MKNLNEALFAFQQKCVAVHKNAKADRYKYADLPTVYDAVTEPLNECGLLLQQRTRCHDTGTVILETSVVHVASGESIASELPIVIDEKPQAFGSRLTYERRYSILTLLGLAPEDDDGLAAQSAALERSMVRRFDARPVNESELRTPPMQSARQPSSPAPAPGGLGRCPKCGADNITYKSGKIGCGQYCWRTMADNEQPRQPPPPRRAARPAPVESFGEDSNEIPF